MIYVKCVKLVGLFIVVLFFEYEMSKCRFMEIVLCDFNLVEIAEQHSKLVEYGNE